MRQPGSESSATLPVRADRRLGLGLKTPKVERPEGGPRGGGTGGFGGSRGGGMGGMVEEWAAAAVAAAWEGRLAVSSIRRRS